MIVAFFHVRQPDTYARIAIAAVKRHMRCPIVHMTDEETPALDGCEVFRLPWDGRDLTMFRTELLSKLDDEVLSLGTDVVIQRDLSPVFAWEFDAALSYRTNPVLDPSGIDVTKSMPFNTDVSFSRGTAFWRAAYDLLIKAEGKFGWFADQAAAAIVARRFRVLLLHCDNFNHTPRSEDEDLSGRYAVHFKGERKPWMLARFGHLCEHPA